MSEHRRWLAAAVVLAAAAVGCGDDGASDDPGSSESAYCRAARAVEGDAPDYALEQEGAFEDAEREYREYLRTDRIQSLLDEARRTAPTEIAAEVDILMDTYDEFIAGDIDLLELYGQTGGETIDGVNQYNRDECGIRSN